jgi:predicted flavoprotein YhiN
MQDFDVIILGAGAAGLMCALRAGQQQGGMRCQRASMLEAAAGRAVPA